MENKTININDNLSIKDKENHVTLRGHVQVFKENTKTGEKSLWDEGDNTITISGAQYILMKIFNLFLDSNHALPYQVLGRDTNLVMTDLNASSAYKIGKNPNEYTRMDSNISENHFIQGFMVGNGGSGEDSITTKNTDYSFTRLRNPIPFQQSAGPLDPSIAGHYIGNLRSGELSFSNNYYIKKFDVTPHIYHSWYSEGQSWDYIDPVSVNDLGPNAPNGSGKTNRIESYIQCEMSIDTLNGDCKSYFEHDGVNDTALINELGLVAYDAEMGNRAIVEALYNNKIKDFIRIIFDNNGRDDNANIEVKALASDIKTICDSLTTNGEPTPLSGYGQSNINAFLALVDDIVNTPETSILPETWAEYQTTLSSADNVEVEAAYNQSGVFLFETDKFLTYLASQEFAGLTNDEAQRIRLVTYYTFKSIPLDENWKISIKYRIYAN